jgi:hypothetical protein
MNGLNRNAHGNQGVRCWRKRYEVASIFAAIESCTHHRRMGFLGRLWLWLLNEFLAEAESGRSKVAVTSVIEPKRASYNSASKGNRLPTIQLSFFGTIGRSADTVLL